MLELEKAPKPDCVMYGCPHCGFRCGSSAVLDEHMDTHSEVRTQRILKRQMMAFIRKRTGIRLARFRTRTNP
ncbi:MAG: hypothetical protein OXG06_00295 [Gammaproteobacteria bacterium]|nr:hypothetical protein [Gammaproteobacteria bacterium]